MTSELIQDPCEQSDLSRAFALIWTQLNAQVLLAKSHFINAQTGNLDGIQPDDMVCAVMKGVDTQQRKFIAVKVTERKFMAMGQKLVDFGNSPPRVYVVFEKYESAHKVWMGFTGPVTAHDCRQLVTLLKQGEVIVPLGNHWSVMLIQIAKRRDSHEEAGS